MSVRNPGFILDNTIGLEKQMNFICKSCYYQIINTGLIRKYINDETCKTLLQALIIYRMDYDNASLFTILLSDKPSTESAELCCTFGDTRTQKGTYNSSFVPAALTSCTFQITLQDSVSYIHVVCLESLYGL